MVEHLPPDSAKQRAEDTAGWTTQDHMLARLNDGVASIFELIAAVNSEDGKYSPPKPMPRPGTPEWFEAAREAREAIKPRKKDSPKKHAFMRQVLNQLLPGSGE